MVGPTLQTSIALQFDNLPVEAVAGAYRPGLRPEHQQHHRQSPSLLQPKWIGITRHFALGMRIHIRCRTSESLRATATLVLPSPRHSSQLLLGCIQVWIQFVGVSRGLDANRAQTDPARQLARWRRERPARVLLGPTLMPGPGLRLAHHTVTTWSTR
jgi:hypothetical protein